MALKEAEANYKGLVIWHADAAAGGAFSAGADLQAMLPVFMSGGAKAIGPEVSKLQNAHMRMKYANVPVIAAVAGLALGGGCELALHAAKRVAALESYIGLVEVGVGLVPAGGGLKEAALRAAAEAKGNDLLQFLKNYFHQRGDGEGLEVGAGSEEDGLPGAMTRHRLQCLRAAARGESGSARDVRRRLPPAAARAGAGRRPLRRRRSARSWSTCATAASSRRTTTSWHDDRRIVSAAMIENGSLVDEQWLLTWSARPSWNCSAIRKRRNGSWA
jgi:3-hydroxyacyl-CoA dehydrogenase